MTPVQSKIANEQAAALAIMKRDRKGGRWGKRSR